MTIPPAEVSLIDWTRGKRAEIRKGAMELIELVAQASAGSLGGDLARKQAIRRHMAHFRQIEECLTRSLAAQKINELKPIRVARPKATPRRSDHAVIYGFPIVKGGDKDWVREGLSPYPPGTPLRFAEEIEKGRRTEIDLPWQGDPGLVPERSAPMLAGVNGSGKSASLLIRFPVDIDLTRLPEKLVVESAAVPPAERRLIEYVRRWTGPDNQDHGALGVIVGPVREPKQPIGMRIRDKGIATNKANWKRSSLACRIRR